MHNPTQDARVALCVLCAERVCMVQMLSMQTACCMLHVSIGERKQKHCPPKTYLPPTYL